MTLCISDQAMLTLCACSFTFHRATYTLSNFCLMLYVFIRIYVVSKMQCICCNFFNNA